MFCCSHRALCSAKTVAHCGVNHTSPANYNIEFSQFYLYILNPELVSEGSLSTRMNLIRANFTLCIWQSQKSTAQTEIQVVWEVLKINPSVITDNKAMLSQRVQCKYESVGEQEEKMEQ